MNVVYIAGPYRASTPWEIEQNIRRAEEVALEVALSGAMPLCPHTMTRFYGGQATDEFWLAGTMELLRRSDAVMLVEGWQDSAGTLAEVDAADDLALPTFRPGEYGAMREWIRHG